MDSARKSVVGRFPHCSGPLPRGHGLLAQTPGTVDDPGTIVVRPAGSEPTLTLGGLIQAQFDGGDKGDARFANDNDRFYLRRARLNATGRFLEDFDFRLEMDLAGTPRRTPPACGRS